MLLEFIFGNIGQLLDIIIIIVFIEFIGIYVYDCFSFYIQSSELSVVCSFFFEIIVNNMIIDIVWLIFCLNMFVYVGNIFVYYVCVLCDFYYYVIYRVKEYCIGNVMLVVY